MKKSELRQIIKEELFKIGEENKAKPIQKDVTKLATSSLMKMITNKLEWEQLLSVVINMDKIPSLSPTHKKSFLLQKIKELSKK
jgi:5-formyltetrahydrofolate cyclo-ligase